MKRLRHGGIPVAPRSGNRRTLATDSCQVAAVQVRRDSNSDGAAAKTRARAITQLEPRGFTVTIEPTEQNRMPLPLG
jgi:hypothetical protein